MGGDSKLNEKLEMIKFRVVCTVQYKITIHISDHHFFSAFTTERCIHGGRIPSQLVAISALSYYFSLCIVGRACLSLLPGEGDGKDPNKMTGKKPMCLSL